jgi:hypothetical protein
MLDQLQERPEFIKPGSFRREVLTLAPDQPGR